MKNIATYQNKYKDRLPVDTINTVANFFKRKGYDILETDVNQSEIGTWYCRISIVLNGELILGTNGKGTSKEYALASGYAELYERFCNRFNYFMSPLFCRDYMNLQKQKKGYYFDSDEKEITFEEAFNNSEIIQDYFQYYCGNIQNIKDLFSIYTNNTNKFIGLPYKNLYNNNDIKYFDPRILYRATASNGMAAGNTLEEALVQGLSELFERWGMYRFYNDPQVHYYSIDLEALNDNAILNIYKKITDLGCDAIVYDLSYNFQIPVILTVLNYKTKYRFYANFATAPVINIAIERTLTEMYQGIKTYKFMPGLQSPYRTIIGDQVIMEDGNNITNATHFPEDVFKKTLKVEYNKHLFLDDKSHTNAELLYDYYKTICNNLNVNVYYRDNSLTKDMSAILIFLDKINTFNAKPFPLEKTSNLLKKEWINRIQRYYNICNAVFSDITNHRSSLNSFMQHIIENNWEPRLSQPITNYFYGITTFGEWLYHYHPMRTNTGILDHFANLHNKNDSFNPVGLTDIGKKKLDIYFTLWDYKECNLYTDEEIKDLFLLWNINITNEDLENYNNIDYIFYKVTIEIEQNFYDSGDYFTVLNSFIKED